jgi:hypothetical protein
MAIFDFTSPEFSDQLKSKAREIIEQSKNEILNHPNFPILVDNYLNKFWLNRADKKEMFVLGISESDLLNINLDRVEDALTSHITNNLKTHSFLILDASFTIISSSVLPHDGTQQAREHLIEMSKKNVCVFFFGEKGITKFIQGDEKGDNIFLTAQDRLNHSEKFELEEIKTALEKYKNNHLSRQNNYVKFFESKQVLISLYGDPEFKIKKNLLRNSPEKYFRDDLIDFLNENVKGTFNREMQLLSSKKPIDIHTESKKDGRLVFFEVKWLGISKHKNKLEEGTSYEDSEADKRANEGVIQTLEYIEEVIIKMNRDLKCAYLILFDARHNRTKLVYVEAKHIPENLQKFHSDKFDKIDDLIVDNLHPCD